jgi:hypothetical protein
VHKYSLQFGLNLALAIVVSVMGILMIVLFMTLPAKAASVSACERQMTLINYRSQLLTAYQKKTDKQYAKDRQLWSGRISYASEWLTVDAEKARDSLYTLDALHEQFDAELTKQIAAYQKYTSTPVRCSDGEAAVATVYKKVVGYENKKPMSGNAKLKFYKDQQDTYQNGEFKKTTEKMITALHKAKKKHPAALYPALTIKEN